MAILPEATRLWSFCFWLFCSSQDPIAIARKGADPTWMKGVDWRHPRLMDSEWGGWVAKLIYLPLHARFQLKRVSRPPLHLKPLVHLLFHLHLELGLLRFPLHQQRRAQ